MKSRLVFLAATCVLVLFSALTGLAAPQKLPNVAGTWQLVLGGKIPKSFKLVLTQDGANLKGTLAPPNVPGGMTVTGTIKAARIAFGFSMGKSNGPTITEHFSGTVQGDSMSGKVVTVIKGFTGSRSSMNSSHSVPWKAMRQK